MGVIDGTLSRESRREVSIMNTRGEGEYEVGRET